MRKRVLRRLSPDAPALGSEEKLRFLRSWLLCLATALASVFEPLGREDAHPRVRQLMLDPSCNSGTRLSP